MKKEGKEEEEEGNKEKGEKKEKVITGIRSTKKRFEGIFFSILKKDSSLRFTTSIFVLDLVVNF